MNYKAIVFIGFNEPSSKKNIKDYFKRHYENTIRGHIAYLDLCSDSISIGFNLVRVSLVWLSLVVC